MDSSNFKMEMTSPACLEPVAASDRPEKPVEERVNDALTLVRPGLHRDGGDAWLIKVEKGVAYLQMIGACGGCSMSQSTLKQYIEKTVREHVPEITAVEQI